MVKQVVKKDEEKKYRIVRRSRVSKLVTRSISMTEEVYEAIYKYAEERDQSISYTVELLTRKALGMKKP
jgi:hypothetical protein